MRQRPPTIHPFLERTDLNKPHAFPPCSVFLAWCSRSESLVLPLATRWVEAGLMQSSRHDILVSRSGSCHFPSGARCLRFCACSGVVFPLIPGVVEVEIDWTKRRWCCNRRPHRRFVANNKGTYELALMNTFMYMMFDYCVCGIFMWVVLRRLRTLIHSAGFP